MSFETATLESLCELVVDCPHSTPKWTDEGIIVLRNQNIKSGVLDLSSPSFTNEDDYLKRIKRAVPKAGDIVFTREAPMGEVCMVPEGLKCCLGQRQVLLRPKSDVNGRYLFWALQSPYVQQQISWNEGTGSTVSNVRIPVLKALNIPRIDNEDMIAKSLSDIASKMMLNVKTNQTLEEMAQAIFKSWFVDFDPVKAKMNGEQPEGMDAITASLFPEKLVESELELIPEGWEVGTLDSHTSMIIDHRGKTPKKLGSDWVEKGYPAISAKNIKSKKIVRPDTIRFIDEATYKKWMKEPLIKGDIIMTSEAPMGELYFFDGSEDFCLSQRLYGLRANSDVCSPEFLFNWLQTTKAKADMEGRASGTTALGIKQAELRKVKILTPPRELLEKYSAVASNLVDMAAKNNAQNTVLEDLRDTLLPKLLSGEIDLEMPTEN
ncbi:restriction endonuclease subunit S [Vibrio crassostreae]|uniref:restriction endonuclease subunit S n=1 Tax=Vibrio crassostreae TaxID=246167 RepID=UPI00104AE5CB|nr:restriction endonuclease subunit S [Vibrio crassostreae]TCV12426.1 type I restriction enzyme S subunit [Vibrio crassostreae]TWD64804.1 type I restriction enzyme S subunit [Vibrio crassostreae]